MTALTLYAARSAASAGAAVCGDGRDYRGRDAALATPQNNYSRRALRGGTVMTAIYMPTIARQIHDKIAARFLRETGRPVAPVIPQAINGAIKSPQARLQTIFFVAPIH
jgi:hypothetical protein